MQYLLIIYGDEALSDPATLQEITAAHMRLGAELQEKGRHGRRQPAEARQHRHHHPHGGRRAESLHMSGPYAETREQLAGYYPHRGEQSLDAAIAWGRKIPGGPNYAVEVRPIWPIPQMG